MESSQRLLELLGRLKRLAGEYRDLTGHALDAITDEIARYEVAERLNDVELASTPDGGYDAVRRSGRANQRLQIRGRRVLPEAASRQRTGTIEFDKEWDSTLLVLLDDHYEATAIYEAHRRALIEAMSKFGSTARIERGQLSVSKFRDIGQTIWERAAGDNAERSSCTGQP